MNTTKSWQDEWKILHKEHENYERFSLVIKLFAVAVLCISFVTSLPLLISILLLMVLWLQEAIWKTFQERIAQRLLFIETNTEDFVVKPFQLYSTWEMQRPNSLNLIKNYLFNALKPTVMYPYVVLILINLL